MTRWDLSGSPRTSIRGSTPSDANPSSDEPEISPAPPQQEKVDDMEVEPPTPGAPTDEWYENYPPGEVDDRTVLARGLEVAPGMYPRVEEALRKLSLFGEPWHPDDSPAVLIVLASQTVRALYADGVIQGLEQFIWKRLALERIFNLINVRVDAPLRRDVRQMHLTVLRNYRDTNPICFPATEIIPPELLSSTRQGSLYGRCTQLEMLLDIIRGAPNTTYDGESTCIYLLGVQLRPPTPLELTQYRLTMTIDNCVSIGVWNCPLLLTPDELPFSLIRRVLVDFYLRELEPESTGKSTDNKRSAENGEREFTPGAKRNRVDNNTAAPADENIIPNDDAAPADENIIPSDDAAPTDEDVRQGDDKNTTTPQQSSPQTRMHGQTAVYRDDLTGSKSPVDPTGPVTGLSREGNEINGRETLDEATRTTGAPILRNIFL